MRILILCLLTGLIYNTTSAQSPTVKWYLDLGDQSFGQTFSKDVDKDGKLELFFSTYRNDGYIYCLNAEDGSVKWKKRFPGEVGSCMDAGPLVFDSAHDGKYRVIAPGSCNYSTKCLDAITGATIWSANITGTDSPPTIGDIDNDGQQDLLLGNFVGQEYCLNPFTGAVQWKIDVNTVDFGICVNTEPVMIKNGAGGYDFVIGTAWASTHAGSMDMIACYNGSDHSMKWKHSVHNTVYEGGATGDLYHDGQQQIVIGNWNDSLYNINVKTGAINWAVQYGSNYMSAVTLADVDNDGFLNIIYNDISKLYVLKTDGSILWQYPCFGPLRGSVAADVNNDLYLDVTFATQDGHVTSLSGLDGSLIRTVDLNVLYGKTFNTDNAPVIADFDKDGILDLFVVGGYTEYPDTTVNYGRAYCFSWGKGKGPEWTMFRHDERRTGCLCDTLGLPLRIDAGEDAHTTNNITILPNPAKNNIAIELRNMPSIPAAVNISITDVAGRTLISQHVTGRKTLLNIDVSTLPAAMYFVKVSADENQYIYKLVIE